jgi:hypothetical protein
MGTLVAVVSTSSYLVFVVAVADARTEEDGRWNV